MIKNLLILLLVSFISIFSTSCDKDDDWIETITVASVKPTSSGTEIIHAFWVKDKENNKWHYFYTPIDGFDYEEGYEYIIKIKGNKIKNPLMDQYPTNYVLLSIISKEKKDSQVPNDY